MSQKQVLDKNLILVVDDDKDFVETVCIAIEALVPNIRLIKAYDGVTGQSLLEKERPALLILDMMLPKKSGFSVLEKIIRQCPALKPFVIIVTANSGPRHRAYAEMLGIDRYLVKPFDMQRLIDEVLSAVAVI
jgi:DNA-binding response OmpR family regulator